MRLTFLLTVFLQFGAVTESNGSDVDGKFALKGIGLLSCNNFVEAKDNKQPSYLHFGGWIEGYISASNKLLPSTYDIAPWQTTETIATIAYTACKKAPEANFARVVDEIVNRKSKSPQVEQSELVKLSHGKYSVTLPESILTEVKLKLKALNLISEETSNEAVKAGLEQYQINKGLTVTRLPDQYTLWNLLETVE